jgi:hypothetical protein
MRVRGGLPEAWVQGGARRRRVATTEGGLPLHLPVKDLLGLRLGPGIPVA